MLLAEILRQYSPLVHQLPKGTEVTYIEACIKKFLRCED